jgi:hypothetical protein
MTDRIRGAAPVAALLLLLAGAPAADAVPVTVNLRVEGLNRTVFDGPVTTDAHVVTTTAAGPHTCDGTNGAAEPAPGPTATGALDDAGRLAGFTIDGPYGNFGIDDYFIERVADEQIDPMTQFWSLWINHAFSDKGGCQKRVLAGQDVLWAAIPFSVDVPLKLTGPAAARTGQLVQVQVIDGQKGTPQAAATVGGATTGADGVASLTFAEAGIHRLKAEKPGTIRSNTIAVCVDPPEADACSSSDKAAPSLQWRLPGRLATEGGRSRTILVSWQADDGAGSGVAYYSVEVRELADGAGPSQVAPDWRSLLDRAPVNALHFRGEAGDAYQFRITAADRAANRATVETDPVVIPVDDRSRHVWRLSRRWKRVRAEAAWGGTVVRASRAGATARLRFRGTRVALIGRRLPKGGGLRVTLDGRSRILRLRGRSAARSVLWTSRQLQSGAHSLGLRTLGRGTVELDAVAPSP